MRQHWRFFFLGVSHAKTIPSKAVKHRQSCVTNRAMSPISIESFRFELCWCSLPWSPRLLTAARKRNRKKIFPCQQLHSFLHFQGSAFAKRFPSRKPHLHTKNVWPRFSTAQNPATGPAERRAQSGPAGNVRLWFRGTSKHLQSPHGRNALQATERVVRCHRQVSALTRGGWPVYLAFPDEFV